MPSNTDQGDELDAILTDVAETICGEWCSGEHTGVDAVNKHMKDEKAKLAEMLLAAEQNALRKFKMRYDLTPSQEQYILRITDPAEYEKQEENYNGTHRMS